MALRFYVWCTVREIYKLYYVVKELNSQGGYRRIENPKRRIARPFAGGGTWQPGTARVPQPFTF